ncbi:MAG: hypothetical protein NW201_13925 [Gemmatimonadales bacterium]|nr:hypothetical protein [Gemmatimonadales bacterium]
MDSTSFQRLSGALYFVAFALIAVPFSDFTTSIVPPQFGNMQWRFASAGLLSGFIFTPLMGVTLGLIVTMANEHRLAQRLLSGFNTMFAVLLLGVMIMFMLDVVQLRREVPPGDTRVAFYFTALRSVLKFAVGIVAFLWLGITGLRTVPASRRRNESGAPLIVGGEAAKA